METPYDIRQKMINTCLSAGIPWMNADTCARVFAVLYVHGNNEYMTHCVPFLQDCEYIQRRFNIMGAEIPDADFVCSVKEYVKELEDYEKSHKDEKSMSALYERHIPEWAITLFRGRYGIELIN